MDRPNKNVARGEATRGQLIAIATRMFADRGYEDTSIEAVLREAGVSRGSLYHHFPSKEALFEAVAEDVETSVGEPDSRRRGGVGCAGRRAARRVPRLDPARRAIRWCGGSC